MHRDKDEERAKNHGRDAHAPLKDNSLKDTPKRDVDRENDSPDDDPFVCFFAAGPFLNPSGEIERHERNLPHRQQDGVWENSGKFGDIYDRYKSRGKGKFENSGTGYGLPM